VAFVLSKGGCQTAPQSKLGNWVCSSCWERKLLVVKGKRGTGNGKTLSNLAFRLNEVSLLRLMLKFLNCLLLLLFSFIFIAASYSRLLPSSEMQIYSKCSTVQKFATASQKVVWIKGYRDN